MANIYDIALAMIPNLGNASIVKMIQKFYSAENIFASSYAQLVDAGCVESLANAIVYRETLPAAEDEWRYCERHGITPVAQTDIEYPKILRDIYAPPHVLYVMGQLSILNRTTISMVGTRKATSYGLSACNKLVSEFAEKVHGAVIVSGLAFGIDSYAHRAALACNIPTVAVLANALPAITPASHTNLAREILHQGGALVSEIHSKQSNRGNGYIARNRIISGISEATIAVESMAKGGSMHTLKIAKGQGRVTCAVPGSIFSSSSDGCNAAIAEGLAYSIASADDVMKLLGHGVNPTEEVRPRVERKSVERVAQAEFSPVVREQISGLLNREGLSELQCKIVESMPSEPLSADEIADRSSVSMGELVGAMVELELLGYVQPLPGSKYQLIKAL